MPLMGNRVMLRALEARDLDEIWEAYKDLDLELTTSGDSPPVSDRQVMQFWEQRINDPSPEMRYFVIEPRSDNPGAGRFAGMCNLYDVDMRNRHAELAIWIGPRNLRGLGYGSEAIHLLLPYAFEVVRLEKVYLGVYDFNEAGIRSYERIGFRYEGRLRHMIYYEGRYWDEWPMRILRTEWDLMRQPPTEGLRPYHPHDQDHAIGLLHQLRHTADREGARAILRNWWRQLDHDVYSFQHNNKLVGLVNAHTEHGPVRAEEVVVLEEYARQLNDALDAASIAHP